MADVTPKQFETWLTPSEAVARLDTRLGSNSYKSKHLLLEHCRKGLLKAVAKNYIVDSRAPITLSEVISQHWLIMRENHIFWDTGSFSYSEWGTSYGLFVVRFDPAKVEEMVGEIRLPTVSESPDPEPPAKGPRVTDRDLEAWFALYRTIYTGANDTVANAENSAKGMFPGKTVNKDRVRALRLKEMGSRPRGRKPIADK